MALSDQERQLFEELERDLVAEISPARIRRVDLFHAGGRVLRSGLVLLLILACGAGLLIQAVRTSAWAGAVLGITGYLLIVFSVFETVNALGRARYRWHRQICQGHGNN